MADGERLTQRFISEIKNHKELNEKDEETIKKDKVKREKRHGAKMLMNMNIYPDFEGFVYYNELLYYLYKFYM